MPAITETEKEKGAAAVYELIQVAENTFYIDCPAKMGVYRLPDGDAILIDSGSDKEAGKKILKIFAEQGWTLKEVINTHSNADHSGGNKLLHDRTGCKIYAAGVEGAFCRFPMLEPSFLYGGFPCKPLRNKFLMAEPSPVEDLARLTPPSGMDFFPLKGHFFDMVGVKTGDGVYFLADCLCGEEILAKYHIAFIYDVAEYLKTLDMVETLSGRLCIPSHAPAVSDIRPLARVNREKVYEIIDSLRQICARQVSFEQVLKSLFDRYGQSLDFNQYVLAGSTVRSYLSYMLDNGILSASFRENRLLWQTVE